MGMVRVVVFLVLSTSCHSTAGLLGAGTGQGSCPAPPYRSAGVAWPDGCPEFAPCCSEFGYCQAKQDWVMAAAFRDCNMERNGLEIPFQVLQAEYLEREAGREVASNELLGITEDLGDIIKNYKPTSSVDENTIPKEVLNDVFGDSKDISLNPENVNDIFGSTSQVSSKTKAQNSYSSGRKTSNNLASGGKNAQNKSKNLTFVKGTTLKGDGLNTQSRPLKTPSSGLNVGSSDILQNASFYSKPNSDSTSQKTTVSKFSSKSSSKSKGSQSKKSKGSQLNKSKGSQSKKSKGPQSKKSKGSQSKKSKGSISKKSKGSQSKKSSGSKSKTPRGSQSIKSRVPESRKSSQSKKSSQKHKISGKGSMKSKRKDMPRTNPKESKTNQNKKDIEGARTATHSSSSNEKPPTTAKTNTNRLVHGPAKICLKSQNGPGKYFCRS